MSKISRRSLLKGGAATAAVGATALSFSQLFQYKQVFAQGDGDDPQTILNLAATAETFACTHYYNALQNADALKLTASEQSQLRTFLDAEYKHKVFLEANGAKALATEFYVPTNLFSDRDTFITTSDTAENWFIAAYLAATRRFAELSQPLLAATAAQVMGVEAEHQALLRLMGGLVPSNRTLKQALFYNTSEVAPLFKPFLEGGDGFTGPAPFPGADKIMEAVGDEGTTDTTPFTMITGPAAMATPGATMDATAAAMVCTVSASNTNIRSAPNTSADAVGKLSGNTATPVTGQTMDANGFTWYKIDQGWVRADAVVVAGNCGAVAVVTP